MTWGEHFTALMKKKGQSEKDITLALVAMGDHAGRQLSDLEAKMMTELAEIAGYIPSPTDEHIQKKVKG